MLKLCTGCNETKECTSGSWYCRDCTKERNRKYREGNREKLNAYDKERYYRNPEIKKGLARKRRLTKREAVNKTNRDYYASHPEYAAQAMLRWWKRRAIKMNALGAGITIEQWENVKGEYFNHCAYCNCETKLSLDHIVPLARGGKHEIENIVPACKACNSSKRDLPAIVFLCRCRMLDGLREEYEECVNT